MFQGGGVQAKYDLRGVVYAFISVSAVGTFDFIEYPIARHTDWMSRTFYKVKGRFYWIKSSLSDH